MTDFSGLHFSPAPLDPKAFALPALPAAGTVAEWEAARLGLRETWFRYLGHGPEQVPLAAEVEAVEELKWGTRSLVSYAVEEDCRVQAYLLQPRGTGPFPGIVVFHPTTDATILEPAGLNDESSCHFGLKLAERGSVALCPRNFLWDYRGGPSQPDFTGFKELAEQTLLGRYPQWTGMGKMVWDGLRAVDYLLTVPTVDPQRLGCVGHSLGAKETLYSLACDERLTVGVFCEGGLGLPFSNWEAPWYLGQGIKQRPDLEHHQLLALIAPRALLTLGGGLLPQSPTSSGGAADPYEDWYYLQAARPIFELYGRPQHLALYLHHEGHCVPLEAERLLYAWFEAHLR